MFSRRVRDRLSILRLGILVLAISMKSRCGTFLRTCYPLVGGAKCYGVMQLEPLIRYVCINEHGLRIRMIPKRMTLELYVIDSGDEQILVGL